MATSRKEGWFAAIGVALGVLFAAGLGLYAFLNSMATPLHPNPQDVQSVTQGTPSPEWAGAVEQARQLARASLVEHNLPGLSVAVGAGGDIVWAEGFGWADLENRVPVTPNTRFRIGHASKALTSAGVGLLLENDRLHLGDEIQTYVPAFHRKEWPVTLRQLMGHMAGVRHYRNEVDYMPSSHCERASEGVQSFADDPLLFEPETQYKYSTFGWILVSAAVEAAAGEPFFTFMRTKIFTPLGMAATTPDSATESIPDRATFYYPRLSGDPTYGPELAPAVDYSCFAGAGGFLSTPADLVRFGVALSTGKLLQRATVRKLQTPQVLASGKETEYGLGWMLETVTLAGEPTEVAGHASRTPVGGSTSFMSFPERGLVVAVVSNISFAETRSIALNIAETFAAREKGPARK
ncbi:MAG TPA: serine hydrolase domain-containing protein [Vicinamibacterales bacterium]|nr:serine hydrolase domain-containing protein [Vicinamibacterales bacterium]